MSTRVEQYLNSKRRSNPYYTQEEWEALKSVLKWCQRCGTTEELTKDHKIPLGKGGTDTLDNLTLLCRECNKNKGSEKRPKDTLTYLLPSQERALKSLPVELRQKVSEALGVTCSY